MWKANQSFALDVADDSFLFRTVIELQFRADGSACIFTEPSTILDQKVSIIKHWLVPAIQVQTGGVLKPLVIALSQVRAWISKIF